MYEDIKLVCKDCGEEFIFTARDQEFYAEKGFQNQPQRCKACREKRKKASGEQRELYIATCSKCGKEAKLRFQPTEGRPVYCSECFAEIKKEQQEQ